MVSKKELCSLYEEVLVKLIEQNNENMRFYVQQKAFSHMTLSIAFWHDDLYWNIWNKDGSKFNEHPKDSHYEFIIHCVGDEKDEASAKLRGIYADWADTDDVFTPFIKLSHEALAAALKTEVVKNKLISILYENSSFKAVNYNDVIHVEDPDGEFKFNFM
ncbi:hypothetical protein VIBRN418_14913 [Vibrio sp. N418]|nr:hypothetical protein VIBRN418_14913 [Vibrio sp. N418]